MRKLKIIKWKLLSGSITKFTAKCIEFKCAIFKLDCAIEQNLQRIECTEEFP